MVGDGAGWGQYTCTDVVFMAGNKDEKWRLGGGGVGGSGYGGVYVYMYYVVMAGNSESRENGWGWAGGKGVHTCTSLHGSQQCRGNVRGGWMTVGWGMYMAGNSTKNGWASSGVG